MYSTIWFVLLCLTPFSVLCAPVRKATDTSRSAGCGSNGFDVDNGGHITRTLAGNRTYLLHIPEGYDKNVPLPVVLSFHGAGGTSAKQERLSQFSSKGQLIAGMPIIAAYPQGVDNGKRKGVWNSAPYGNKSVDDIQFTKDIVADISTSLCVNPKRIYASGKSIGGGMTNLLACTPSTSTLFAAFAPISAALYPESLVFSGCSPARQIPIITSHGTDDKTIPFNGRPDKKTGKIGVGHSTIKIPLWRDQWAQRNGFNGSRTEFPVKSDVIKSDGGNVTAFTVQGLGHSWPTTKGLDRSGAPDNVANFNITQTNILPFFTLHQLP